MEVLQNGSASSLVTNLEVMQLLQERIATRQTHTESTCGISDDSTSRKNQFKNRDWIEQTVLNHLQSSPVGKINSEKMFDDVPKLVEILRRDPATSIATLKYSSSIGTVDGKKNSSPTDVNDDGDKHLHQFTGYGLSKTETLHILNHLPTSLVELHLLINDLENREHLDDEEKQLELLRLISQFVGRPMRE